MIDFKQPTTWRGIIGLLSMFGISISPELTTQIAVVAGALLSIIEIIRNEYRAHRIEDVSAHGTQDTTGPNRPAAADPVAADPVGLRRLPPDNPPPPPPGFGDR